MNSADRESRIDELENQIELALLRDSRISSQNIAVTVANSEARLTGKVSSHRRKLVAQQIVAEFPGIRQVQNDLQVEPGVTVTDEEIIIDVRAALDASADITKKTVIVSVTGGVVTLTGHVATDWERVVAEDVARGVRGVRDVVNVLIVDAHTRIDDHELMNSVQAALSRARGLKDTDIAVAIGNGTVVLSGTVREDEQKQLAESIVGGFGLLHIHNEIQTTGRS